MAEASARIRAARPPRPAVDPWRPIDVLQEEERLPGGGLAPTVTVFLAGAECPFTCVFCDLWRFTLDGPTPAGAIPAQLRLALDEAGPVPSGAQLKLYNASNFFDRRAVPPADDAAVAALAAPFARVVVECHPRLVERRCFAFARRLSGRLQVAMGLETVCPEAVARLNKGADLDDFRRAAAALRDHEVELRAFVLIGAPFVPPEEDLEWVVRSVDFAFAEGAAHVALVPVRGGPGEMVRLAAQGDFTSPPLSRIEAALDRCLAVGGRGVVTVDSWDLERFASCPACTPPRLARLARINRSGAPELAVACPAGCGA